MKKTVLPACIVTFTFLLFAGNTFAQSFINFSKYIGGSGQDDVKKMQVVNGETYLISSTNSPDYVVTDGSVFKGNRDLVASKFNSNGNLIFSTYLGSTGNDIFFALKIINGEMFILSTADSSGFPVTNGSVYQGRTDVVFTRLSATGAIISATYLGGSNGDYPTDDPNNLLISGNDVIIIGFTLSADFPTTGDSYHGGSRDGFIAKVNASNGAVDLSTCIGGNLEDNLLAAYIENGFVYLSGNSFSADLPVTIGNVPGPARSVFVVKMNISNFNIIYYRYLGGNGTTTGGAAAVLNGEFFIAGFTSSQNYPVTNGSTITGLSNDRLDGFYTRLNSSGSIIFSTYLATEGADFLNKIIIGNNDLYLVGTALSNLNPGRWDVLVYKINFNGSVAYSKKLSLGTNFQFLPAALVVNNELYLSGITNGSDYPVTNGSQYYSGGTGYFSKLDASGNISYSTFTGKMNALLPMEYDGNYFYLLGSTSISSYPVTDSTLVQGSVDNILAVLKPDGTNVFGTYTGGTLNDIPQQLATNNGNVYFSGITNSLNYPVTANSLLQGPYDQYLTKISFCPATYNVDNDTLSPKIQTVCKTGLAQSILGNKITVPGNLATIYLNGIATQQTTSIEASYQWQSADAPAGPYTNIPTAVFKDYRPVLGATDQYYRRLSYTPAECGTSLIHISDTASAILNNFIAPVVNGGGNFSTCPGTAIIIGGAPTVSGGNPPYLSYLWDMGAAPEANPTVSPANSTIYTLIVTDALGCSQIGQSNVFTYKADAGADKSSCAGVPVRIGGVPVAGLAGVEYNWLPGSGLSANNIAQPFAVPSVNTDYVLTLTIPTTGSGTCSTADTVKVKAVAAPLTPDFAGPDRVICLKTNASLGKPAEPGFNYVWSPGSYLTSNTTSTTTYAPGNILIPTPDPVTIFVTAQKDGCSFSDQVIVTTIESRAGFTGCGPRIVGLPDRTADINETYSWSRISGPGNFTGATNLPQVPVSASIGGTTIYGLTVTYNGGSCFSQVEVPEVCIGCNTTIRVDAKYKCPSFGINGGEVSMIATSNLQNPVFTWTPQVGLSAYTGSIVQLTDNVPRIYTVLATDLNDSSQRCAYDVFVNDPAFSLPVFSARDTIACANIPVNIGVAPVAGYTYLWNGPGLSNNSVSNPVATIPFETVYPVKITDGNGCEILDTVIVKVENVKVDAGVDWTICSNALVSLGTVPQPNTTYVWEPQSAPWQNGTNQNSAQPEVFIANDITFTVTATSPAGCVSTDEVNVTINAIPAIPDAGDTILCLNKPILIGSPALPGVIYNWAPTSGLSDPNIAQPLANPAVTTTYSLTASFPGTCNAAATDQVTVTVSDPAFNLPDINYCPGNGPITLGTNAPVNMLSYAWAPVNLVTNPAIANPLTTNSLPALPTLLTLTVVNIDGCFFKDTIRLIPSVSLPEAGADKVICKGQSTSIGSATNTSGAGISYQWNPSINLSNPFIPNPVFTGATGGAFTYILVKTDSQLSCITTDTLLITVVDEILPVINTPVFCENSCNQIGTTALAGIQYQWLPATGLSNANIANPLACVGAVTVSYTLTATNTIGCSSSATIVVGVNNVPAPQVNVPDVSICLGEPSATFNPVITTAGSYSYLWNPDNGTLNNVNILSPSVSPTVVGNLQYQLQVTDNNSGCSNTAIANLFVNECSPLAIVGDFVWYDANFNGLQDAAEFGETGIIVHLYNSAGFNVANAVTDGNGQYYFTNVQPGNDYYVIFDLPAGYSFTLQNVGGITATNNSKANILGRSNNFNILSGASILNIDAGIIPAGCGCGGPVPVTLLNFNGTLRNRQVFLNWQTSSEYNNHYFSIERSDATDFTAIGRVNGNGTSSLVHNYSFIDQNPMNGINYYRLKQVDFDGTARYSPIVPIFLDNNLVANVYYNNVNNTIRVIFNKVQQNVSMKLFGSNAQLIKTESTTNNITDYTIQLPVIAHGIYILQISNGESTIIKKLMIGR